MKARKTRQHLLLNGPTKSSAGLKYQSSIGFRQPPYALIGGLVVKEGFRNQKVGLRLCEKAEAWSWETGVAVVRVTSRSSRFDAHRFYQNNGYRLTKVSQNFEKKRPA